MDSTKSVAVSFVKMLPIISLDWRWKHSQKTFLAPSADKKTDAVVEL